ncbi:MAG TPA: DUF2318 domain-containing protein [Firmicutes bacterium]|nr:DUF2318 domain-containing protein [Bacillota bacterium]
MSTRKKAKVLGRGHQRRSPARVLALVLAAGVVLLLAGMTWLGLAGRDSGYALGSRRYDPETRIQQTELVPEFRNGKVYVDLSTIKEKAIVRFEIPNQPVTLPNGSTFDSLPITAYVAPSGRLVAAVSFCEPCSGTTFHIQGDRLVCNVCGTQWKLEDLRGIYGGCLMYPPDEVKYQVEDGKLVLDEQGLRSWQPRM